MVDLPVRGEAPSRSYTFNGQDRRIIVLDFFAYWCAPCARVSPILEEQIGNHYKTHHGNPQQIPVELVAVNIESGQPRRTDAFIRRAGLSKVLDDFKGTLLGHFDATGIPLIVVLETQETDAGYVVRYKHSGFEGVEKLRDVIDSIGVTRRMGTDSNPGMHANIGTASVSRLAEVEQTFQTAAEVLWNNDYQLTQWNMRYGQAYDRTEWDLGATVQTYALEMRSPDPFFTARQTQADRLLGQLRVDQEVREDLKLRLQMGYYRGFQSYRALWLHDYYAEIGRLPFLEAYPDVEPRGGQIGTQARWEYLSSGGFLEGGILLLRDHIAPSAEFERVTVIGRDRIDSVIYRLATENVLNARMRSLLEIQCADTTERQRRWSLQGSLNSALTESLVLRTQVGMATEKPDFDAWFAGLTLEHDLGNSWLLSAFGRLYHDTGELQPSIASSNAPPGLESYQAGIGLRWVGDRSSARISAGPYWTRYEDSNLDAPFFEDLYRGRDWGLCQAAFEVKF
ncbi:TlpA family protein disulfide reductase [Verrucomicrobia bacterium]|nr:TlpA family protein disulfide reductase [Verrucomicrobiota bacterium]MDG1891652.1 TlpA disulfide reductase family protein [Verrucomicrobiota bacterium]